MIVSKSKLLLVSKMVSNFFNFFFQEGASRCVFFSHTFIDCNFFLENFFTFSHHVEAGLESDLFWLISLLEMCVCVREHVCVCVCVCVCVRERERGVLSFSSFLHFTASKAGLPLAIYSCNDSHWMSTLFAAEYALFWLITTNRERSLRY